MEMDDDIVKRAYRLARPRRLRLVCLVDAIMEGRDDKYIASQSKFDDEIVELAYMMAKRQLIEDVINAYDNGKTDEYIARLVLDNSLKTKMDFADIIKEYNTRLTSPDELDHFKKRMNSIDHWINGAGPKRRREFLKSLNLFVGGDSLHEAGSQRRCEFLKSLDLFVCDDSLHEPTKRPEEEPKGGTDERRNDELYHALHHDDVLKIREIIDRYPKLDVNGIVYDYDNGITPLHVACLSTQKDCLKILEYLVVEEKANVNGVDVHGNTPLLLACKNGNLEVCEFLVSHGASINVKSTLDGYTPFLHACSGLNPRLVAFLIEVPSVDINAVTMDKSTALHLSARAGSLEICRLLLSTTRRTFDVNSLNRSSSSSLHFACGFGNNENLAEFLLDVGAEVNAKNEDGRTPLHYASRKGNNVELIELLLDRGADVNSRDEDGDTPLHEACYVFRADIMKVLVRDFEKVKFSVTNLDGLTPLECAEKMGASECAKVIMEATTAKMKYNRLVEEDQKRRTTKTTAVIMPATTQQPTNQKLIQTITKTKQELIQALTKAISNGEDIDKLKHGLDDEVIKEAYGEAYKQVIQNIVDAYGGGESDECMARIAFSNSLHKRVDFKDVVVAFKKSEYRLRGADGNLIVDENYDALDHFKLTMERIGLIRFEPNPDAKNNTRATFNTKCDDEYPRGEIASTELIPICRNPKKLGCAQTTAASAATSDDNHEKYVANTKLDQLEDFERKLRNGKPNVTQLLTTMGAKLQVSATNKAAPMAQEKIQQPRLHTDMPKSEPMKVVAPTRKRVSNTSHAAYSRRRINQEKEAIDLCQPELPKRTSLNATNQSTTTVTNERSSSIQMGKPCTIAINDVGKEEESNQQQQPEQQLSAKAVEDARKERFREAHEAVEAREAQARPQARHAAVAKAKQGERERIQETERRAKAEAEARQAAPEELSIEYIHSFVLGENPLGQGAYGIVYHATDESGTREFALKKVLLHLQKDSSMHKRVKDTICREITFLSTARHPNIVRLIGYRLDVSPGNHVLLFEYVSRGSLSSVLASSKERGLFNATRRLHVILQIARALHYLHQGAGIPKGGVLLHRDIKSDNICLTSDFQAKLIDCGLGKIVDDENNSVNSYIQDSGSGAFGSEGYRCPWYSGGKRKYKPACDIYSFGIVMMEVITSILQGGVPSSRSEEMKAEEGSRIKDLRARYLEDENQVVIENGELVLIKDADPIVAWDKEVLKELSKLSIKCCDGMHIKRPDSDDLVEGLSNVVHVNEFGVEEGGRVLSSVGRDKHLKCHLCTNARSILCSQEHGICSRCLNTHIEQNMDHPSVACPIVGCRCDPYSREQLKEAASEHVLSAYENRQYYFRHAFSLATIEQQMQRLSQAIANQSSRLLEPCPRLLYIKVPQQKDWKGFKSWFRKEVYVYLICQHTYTTLDKPIKLTVPKAWVVKIAPALKYSIVILKILSKSLQIPVPFGVIDDYEVLINGLMGFDESMDSAKHALDRMGDRTTTMVGWNRQGPHIVNLVGPSYEMLSEKLMKEKRSWWRNELKPILNSDGDLIYVKTKYVTEQGKLVKPDYQSVVLNDVCLRPLEGSNVKRPYDVFIVHTGEQKPVEVSSMHRHFHQQGYRCFVDKIELNVPKGNPKEYMGLSLETCRHVVVVLSKAFLRKSDPCAELQYAYKRMKWLRSHGYWESLWIVLRDITVEDYKIVWKETGKKLPDIHEEIQISFILGGNNGGFATWDGLCDDLIRQITQYDDEKAVSQWKKFLENWESHTNFEKADSIYDLPKSETGCLLEESIN